MEYLYHYTSVDILELLLKNRTIQLILSIRHTAGSQFPNRVSFDIKDLQFLSKKL